MATAAASRPSGPVLSVPSYHSASPARVKLAGAGAARSLCKTVSVSSPKAPSADVRRQRSCMCSPTNHPGSFRCSLHKQQAPSGHGHSKPASSPSPVSTGTGDSTCRLGGANRMGSALVRLGGAVESRTWARRALTPSPQSPHRRRASGSFRTRPSRLSAVSFAGDRAGDNIQ